MLVRSNEAGSKHVAWCVQATGMLTPLAAKKKVEEEADEPEQDDEWDKVEEEEWDPDFDEFDVPKSRTGKSGGKEDGDDLNFEEDEEFKNLFDDEGFEEEGADDDY